MSRTVRIAAVADIHVAAGPAPIVQSLLSSLPSAADVLLLCGDLTHHGLAEEGELVARSFGVLSIPVLAVLGNHDYHSDQQEGIRRVLTQAGIQVLDGDATVVHGIGFAGVKGFASGFGRRMLEPWGEPIVKQFVHEAVNEGLKMGSALARLTTPQRIAMLHYSPILETVEGEPAEIHAFLGSTHLEEPLDRFGVTAAFHGHAHHGRPEGRTRSGAPVYNVSLPLLTSLTPEGPPFRLIEVVVEDA